mgnify:CR=1 FL=1
MSLASPRSIIWSEPNEELETSREELQSLNEELVTVNNQLEEKIKEVEKSSDDPVAAALAVEEESDYLRAPVDAAGDQKKPTGGKSRKPKRKLSRKSLAPKDGIRARNKSIQSVRVFMGRQG